MRYWSALRLARMVSAKSGCWDKTRIVFIARAGEADFGWMPSPEHLLQKSRKGQWILGSCPVTFEPSIGHDQFVPKLLVQHRLFQKLRVLGTAAGRFRLHRQADVENISAVRR